MAMWEGRGVVLFVCWFLTISNMSEMENHIVQKYLWNRNENENKNLPMAGYIQSINLNEKFLPMFLHIMVFFSHIFLLLMLDAIK